MDTIYHTSTYTTETGTLHIGTASSYSCLPNGSGDGEFTIMIATSRDAPTPHHDYMAMVGGTAYHVYGDDGRNHPIATLHGRWGVYMDIVNSGNMLMKPFDDDSSILALNPSKPT